MSLDNGSIWDNLITTRSAAPPLTIHVEEGKAASVGVQCCRGSHVGSARRVIVRTALYDMGVGGLDRWMGRARPATTNEHHRSTTASKHGYSANVGSNQDCQAAGMRCGVPRNIGTSLMPKHLPAKELGRFARQCPYMVWIQDAKGVGQPNTIIHLVEADGILQGRRDA